MTTTPTDPAAEAADIIAELDACYLYGMSEKSDKLAQRIIALLRGMTSYGDQREADARAPMAAQVEAILRGIGNPTEHETLDAYRTVLPIGDWNGA